MKRLRNKEKEKKRKMEKNVNLLFQEEIVLDKILTNEYYSY